METILIILGAIMLFFIIKESVIIGVFGSPILNEYTLSLKKDNIGLNRHDPNILSFYDDDVIWYICKRKESRLFKYYINYNNGQNRLVWKYSKLSKQIDNYYKQAEIKYETSKISK